MQDMTWLKLAYKIALVTPSDPYTMDILDKSFAFVQQTIWSYGQGVCWLDFIYHRYDHLPNFRFFGPYTGQRSHRYVGT